MERSEQSFFQVTGSRSELEQKISTRKKFEDLKALEPTPTIYESNTGSKTDYVLVFGEFRYPFDDFLQAFDAAFKLINFLNMPFPRESIKFWTIIQALLYELPVDVTGRMCSIIQTLRLQLKKPKSPSPKRTKSSKRTESPKST